MDYKEKYENALNIVDKVLDILTIEGVIQNKQGFIRENMERAFPELKENSEEKIRKRIIQAIKIREKSFNEDWTDELDWLDKQKTSSEALEYLKQNHSPSDVSDFQAAMNIAVARAYDAGKKQGKPTKWEDVVMMTALDQCIEELRDVNGWNYVYVDGKDIPLQDVQKWYKQK